MRGSALLLGAVTGNTTQTCSRIPHLWAHILSRKSRLKASRDRAGPQHVPRRFRSASVSLGAHVEAASASFEAIQRKAYQSSSIDTNRASSDTGHAEGLKSKSPGTGSIDKPSFSFYGNRAVENVDPAEREAGAVEPVNIYDVLQEGHPERILFALLDPANNYSFVKEAEDEIFTKAFTSLDPGYFVEPFKDLARYSKPSLETDPNIKYRRVRSLADRLATFATHLDKIVTARRSNGRRLSLLVYKHVLKCARAMGDGRMATHVFDRMMPEDGVVPDLSCYNYHMEALCWSNAWSKAEQFSLRVTPRILGIRSSQNPPIALSGHSVARAGSRISRAQHNLRHQTLTRFKQLVEYGYKGDEETFTNLMIAMGRESDIEGVKSILKSVWNIDVGLLDAYDEEEVESPTFYETDSPLRPSSRLLFTVVHVFGTNNDVGLAFSLVDYISRNYDLKIPDYVWRHLCEWTMILSLQRVPRQRKQGLGIGKVGPQVFDRLWQTMVDEPHNVKPDAVLRTLRAKAMKNSLDMEAKLANIREARQKLDLDRKRLENLTKQTMQSVTQVADRTGWDGLMPTTFLESRRKFLLVSLQVDRDLQLLIGLIRKFFVRSDWVSVSKGLLWERQQLPALIEEFGEYIPNCLRYTTRSGRVEIAGHASRTNILRITWGDQMTKVGMIRAALDTDDHAALEKRLQNLPAELQMIENYCFICSSAGHRTCECHKEAYYEKWHMAGTEAQSRHPSTRTHGAVN